MGTTGDSYSERISRCVTTLPCRRPTLRPVYSGHVNRRPRFIRFTCSSGTRSPACSAMPPPVEPGKQRLERRIVHQHQPVLHGGPGERLLFQPLVGHHQPGALPIQQLQPIRLPGAEDKDSAREPTGSPCRLPQITDPAGRWGRDGAYPQGLGKNRRRFPLAPERALRRCPQGLHLSVKDVSRAIAPVMVASVQDLTHQGVGSRQTVRQERRAIGKQSLTQFRAAPCQLG